MSVRHIHPDFVRRMIRSVLLPSPILEFSILSRPSPRPFHSPPSAALTRLPFLPHAHPLLRNCHLLSNSNACKQRELRLPTCELCSPFLLAACWPWVDLKHNKKANNHVGEDVSRCPTRTHTICSGRTRRRGRRSSKVGGCGTIQGGRRGLSGRNTGRLKVEGGGLK